MPDDSPTGAPSEPAPNAEPLTADAPTSRADATPDADEPSKLAKALAYRPPYFFLAGVSLFVLVSDLWSKRWAVRVLETERGHIIKEVIKDRLQFVLARNPGGAWGMLHDQPEKVRKPFFVLVSVIAVAVIVGMYRKLDAKQRALRWGLPLVLGGALGNLVDRIGQGKVIDFIDYRADWVLSLNKLFVKLKIAQNASDHWPTFNVADIAICIGVVLMAIDFLFPHKVAPRPAKKKGAPKGAASEADASEPATPEAKAPETKAQADSV